MKNYRLINVNNLTDYLTVDEKKVNLTGKEVLAMAINYSIPVTTLHFSEMRDLNIQFYHL